jgi:hypothetical protein
LAPCSELQLVTPAPREKIGGMTSFLMVRNVGIAADVAGKATGST